MLLGYEWKATNLMKGQKLYFVEKFKDTKEKS